MSLTIGYGESGFPSILGDGGTTTIDSLEVNTITINDAMIVDNTTILPEELAQLTGIHTNQTIQQQIDNLVETYAGTGYWFSGWSTQDQAPAAANTPYYATLNSYDASSNEIILYDGSGGIYNAVKVLQKSVYNIQFSIQTSTSTSSKAEVRVWLRKNGTDIPDSGGEQSISTNDGNFIMSYNIILPLEANDYISLMWAVDDTNLHLEALPALTTPYNAAASPSVIITFQQVLNIIPGPAGDAATVTVGGTTTLAAGSSATVTNSGTSSAAVLNFGIPRGNKGDTGETGPQGPQGPQGPKGDPGEVTTLQMTEAIAASSAADLLAAGIAATAYTDSAITLLTTTTIDPIAADVALLTAKTVNQTAVAGVTTFAGTVETEILDATTIYAETEISGTATIDLIATVGATNIKAPYINIESAAGTGSVSIGGLTDIVYINGFPFLNFFQQYTP